MYSPPTAGAACTPSATIDKQNTSNRRFIIYGEEDYLCGVRNSQVAGRDSPTRPIFADVEPTRPRVVTSKQTARGRAVSRSFLPIWIDFSPREVAPSLPPPDQCELIAANQCFCRERTRIIVRGHHKSVRAGAHDREQIAFE